MLSVSSSAQPASHVQPQTCTVAVRVEPWYDGDGPCPSEEVYASLVSCSDLGFALGPRINAGGRVGESTLGVRLLTTQDPEEAQAIAASGVRFHSCSAILRLPPSRLRTSA